MNTGSVWTGRLEFDLNNGLGFSVATVEVSMRLDVALFFIGNRTVAAIDRDRLRAWFERPYEPFVIDDVEFCMLGNDLCFRVDDSTPFVLPDWLTNQMATYV